MSKKEKWDGKSRPVNDKYRNNYNNIFGVKTPYDELQEELIKGDNRFGQIKKKKEEKKMYQELAKKIGVPVDELEGYEEE